MYQIKCDDKILFDLRDKDLIVANPKLKLEVNRAGELSFTIYADHPYFNDIKKLKSIIRVYQFRKGVSIDGKLLFKGRVIESEQFFNNEKKITCESKLAMLIDSQTPPFALEGGTLTSGGQTIYTGDASPARLFKWVVEQHNKQVEDFQKFALDETEVTIDYTIDGAEYTKTVPKYCTVVDANDTIIRSNTAYDSTFNTITTKFVELLGGYINVKYDVEKDGEIVDLLEYVHDFTHEAAQTIEFGENLLDIEQAVNGADVATVLIPLGKSEGESSTTIAEIADGEYNDLAVAESGADVVKEGDRIWSKEAVEKYGKIVKTITFDDVEEAQNLFKKAVAKLKGESVLLGATITLKAVDLALVDKDIESFYWQDKIRVYSKPHGITEGVRGALYLLEAIDHDLLEPQNTEIVLGKTWRTLTDVTLGAGREASGTAKITNEIYADYTTNQEVKDIANNAVQELVEGDIDAVIETSLQNSSLIAQTAEEIIFEVVQNYVEKVGYEEYQEDISTTLQLLAEEMVLKFDTAITEIENVDGEVQTQFQEISKYIRFADGKIILGEVGNEITLEISNNRLSFLQNNLEVAYLSDNKLFVNNSEFLGGLKIGNFAFTPRTNGNLSLKLSTATTPDIDDSEEVTE